MGNKALTLVNGIPRMTTITELSGVYDDSYAVVSTLSPGTNITLPNGGTYTNKDLRVYLNGAFLEPGVDYTWIGVTPRTQIQTQIQLVNGDNLHFRINGGADPLTIYDEVIAVDSTITTGTNITLPLSKTYADIELEVYLNGQLLEDIIDYTYVGALPPRTQIQMTFDLMNGDRLRFRIGD